MSTATSRPRPARAAWSGTAGGLATVAVFVGVLAAMGAVPALPVPGVAVPVTLQSMGVMLAGAVLGRRRGTAAVVVFLVLVAAGLPLLSGGRGGLAVFAGPSVGFLVGFVAAAFVVGWLVEASGARSAPRLVAATLLGGVVVLHLFGIAGLALRAGLPLPAAALATLVFLPGDVAKAVLAGVVAAGVHRALPDLLPRRARD